MAQRPDDRNAPRHARFESDRPAMPATRIEDLPPVKCEQGLVGGDDILAPLQQIEDKTPREIDAAYDLDRRINAGILEHRASVRGEQVGRYSLGPRLVRIANDNA